LKIEIGGRAPLHWIISGGFRTNGAFKLCMAGETGRVYQPNLRS